MMPSYTIPEILVGLLFVIARIGAEERCQFPRAWKGKWYQSGLGEVVIRERLITEKGSCFEHHRDYYLVRNRENDCFQCLLMMERHNNIIQYKESYCVSRDSLRNICDGIMVEAPLYTLVREPAVVTKCPFKDAFYFDYNDLGSGFCPEPISYAKPCAGYTKYKLHFKHCKEWALFHNSDLELSCVASWKSGSDNYMYGQFKGHGLATKDQRYRCFKYDHFGNDMNMAMSVDATCQGLRSSQDGPVNMVFTKDIYRWSPPACSYPDWLADVRWRDIDGRHTFSFVTDSRVMTGYYQKRMTTNAEVQSEHRCVEVMEDSSSNGERTAIVYSFTTYECTSKNQCLKFVRTTEGKVKFYQGVLGDYDSGRVCLTDGEYEEHKILMEENPHAVECPMRGNYLLQNGEGCNQKITIGCDNRTLLTFSSTCSTPDGEVTSPALSLQCILTWEEAGRVYLLAKEPGVVSRLVNCFSFKERHNTVHYTTDRKCGSVASGMMDKSVKFELLQKESCDDPADPMVLPLPPGSRKDEATPRDYTANPDGPPRHDVDIDYVDIENSNPAPHPPAGVTAVPKSPSRDYSSTGPRRDRDDRRRDRDRPRDRQRDRDRYGDDEDLALSDADRVPVTRGTTKDTNSDVIDKPYPKYSQVDQSKMALPTDGANRRHHPSSADTLHTWRHLLVVHIPIILTTLLLSR